VGLVEMLPKLMEENPIHGIALLVMLFFGMMKRNSIGIKFQTSSLPT
jgi:hypothetical protein